MLSHPATPALASPIRRAVVTLGVTAAAVLGLLAVGYAGVDGAGRLDAWTDARIRDGLEPYRNELLRFVYLAGPRGVAAGALLLALACLVLHRPRLAVIALAGPLLTAAATTVLQPAIGRTLDGGDALPSGHTAGVTAVATVAALVAVSLAGRRRGTVALLSVAGVLAVGTTMAVALAANELHYVTDTVAGFCTAVAVVLGTALAVDAVADRLRLTCSVVHGRRGR